MRVTLENLKGETIHSQEIKKRNAYPDACFYDGRIYIAIRVLHGKDGAIYREKNLMTLPEEEVVEDVPEGAAV